MTINQQCFTFNDFVSTSIFHLKAIDYYFKTIEKSNLTEISKESDNPKDSSNYISTQVSKSDKKSILAQKKEMYKKIKQDKNFSKSIDINKKVSLIVNHQNNPSISSLNEIFKKKLAIKK